MGKKNRKEESYEEWLKEQEDKRKNIVPYKYFIQALEKSYSHKPHLADLPYDRRSNNIDELQERLDEIDKRVKANERLIENEKKIQEELTQTNRMLQEEIIEKYQPALEEIELKEQQFETYDKEMQEEAYESIDSIVSRFEEECPDLNHAVIDGKPNLVYSEMMGLNELFSEGGLITSMNAEGLNNLAGELVDYAYDKTGGDDTPWSNRVIGIADDLRYLARKHDINNSTRGGELAKELDGYKEEKEYLQNEIKINRNSIRINEETIRKSEKEQSRLENENKDYQDEKSKTEGKIKEVKDTND